MYDFAAFVDPDRAIDIPFEIIDLICWHLDPFSLGRAACVSKAWQEAASAETIWRQFTKHSPTILSPRSCKADGQYKSLFGKLASGQPHYALSMAIRLSLLLMKDPSSAPLAAVCVRLHQPVATSGVIIAIAERSSHMERWRSSRRMNIMSKSFPVVVRLEWASASACTARYLVTLDMDNLPRALHCPSIDQVCSTSSHAGYHVHCLKADACLKSLQ